MKDEEEKARLTPAIGPVTSDGWDNDSINAVLERELRHTKYGATMPTIDLENRNSMIRWMAWNDRNGCYTDEDRKAEDFDPLTLDEARAAFLEIFVEFVKDLAA